MGKTAQGANCCTTQVPAEAIATDSFLWIIPLILNKLLKFLFLDFFTHLSHPPPPPKSQWTTANSARVLLFDAATATQFLCKLPEVAAKDAIPHGNAMRSRTTTTELAMQQWTAAILQDTCFIITEHYLSKLKGRSVLTIATTIVKQIFFASVVATSAIAEKNYPLIEGNYY